MLNVGLQHYLVLSAILLALGLMIVLTKRNAVAILVGVEFILNSANLNLVAFSRYGEGGGQGQVAALFVIVLAAAEAAVALAIFLNFYNSLVTVDVDRGKELKG
jgi:NADH-quinone oxidoreductase subunit K